MRFDRETLWRFQGPAGVLAAVLLWPLTPMFGPPLVAVAVLNWLMTSRRGAGAEGAGRLDSGWDLTALLMAALVFTVHFQLLTHGTGWIFDFELLGHSFDSLASFLLHGSSEVSPRAILWEGMQVEGRTVMYFGPWPALLRLPLAWLEIMPAVHWSRLSCYIAAVLTLCGFVLICGRELARNGALERGDRRQLLLVSIFGFGLGSPLAFLMFSAWIYHEAVLWGLCGSTWALYFMLSALRSEGRALPQLFALSFAAGGALLARVTYGVPLYGVLALVTWSCWRRAARTGSSRPARDAAWIGVCLLPATAMLVFQLWYNFDRFGDVTTFADYQRLEYLVENEESWLSFEQWGAVNPLRLPTGLWNYLGVQLDYFSSDFPWIRVARPSYPEQNLYPQMFQSYVISLSIVSLWLVLPAALGCAFLIFRSEDRFLKLCGLCLFTQVLLVGSFFIMEQRYAADLLPLLIFGYAYFLGSVYLHRPFQHAGRVLANGMLLAVVLSSIATLSSTVSVIPVSGPAVLPGYKTFWSQRFQLINRGIEQISERANLGSEAPDGTSGG
jgi:hypothetical protein